MLSPEDLDVLKRTVIILRNQEEDAHARALAEFIDEVESRLGFDEEMTPSPDTHLGAVEHYCYWRDGGIFPNTFSHVCTREHGHKGPHIAHRHGDDEILAIERQGRWVEGFKT